MFLFTFILVTLMGCAGVDRSPLQALSDESLSQIAEPLYTRSMTLEAQNILRRRAWIEISESDTQSTLRGFACLVVSQALDPSSARGERAFHALPCGGNRKCPHLCKRSRLPKSISLPKEYREAASRHDEILWRDLEVHQNWQEYLTRCLECERALEAKANTCLEGIGKLDLLGNIEEGHLQTWWHRCASVKDPKVEALRRYRKWMLSPPIDLPLDLEISPLPAEYAQAIKHRVIVGEARRLAFGPLDGPRIERFLKHHPLETQPKEHQEAGREVWSQLAKRSDAQLMPCLEWGLKACSESGQEETARIQALGYLERCQECSKAPEVDAWLGQRGLKFTPRWSIEHPHAPHAKLDQDFYVLSGARIARFNLGPDWSASHQWSYFTQKNGTWWTGAEEDDSLDILSPKWMTWGLPQGMKGSPTVLYLRSNYQLIAFDLKRGAPKWIYSYPTDKSAVTFECNKILPLESGVICVGDQRALLFDDIGEISLRLECGESGCGEVIAYDDTRLVLLEGTVAPTVKLFSLTDVNLLMVGEGERRYPQRVIPLTERVFSVHLFDDHLVTVTPKKLNVDHVRSGARVWSTRLSTPLTASPIVHGEVMILFNARELFALNMKDGQRLWKTKSYRNKGRRAQRRRARRSRSEPVLTTPEELLSRERYLSHLMTHQTQLYFFNSTDQLISAHHLSTGDLIWTQSLDEEGQVGLVTLDRHLWVSAPQNGIIYGLSLTDGSLRWRLERPPFERFEVRREWLNITDRSRTTLYAVSASTPIIIQMEGPPPPSRSSRAPAPPSFIPRLTKMNSASAQDWNARCSLGEQLACLHRGERLQERWGAEASSEQNRSIIESIWDAACYWGEAEGCYRLGISSLTGLTTQDSFDERLTQAKALFSQADTLKLGEAALQLGYIYQGDHGGGPQYVQAQSAFRRACDRGVIKGCARLAWLYELGLGSVVRPTTAIHLYREACLKGDEWACEQQGRFELKLSSSVQP